MMLDVQKWLLCAYFDAPSMRIKTGLLYAYIDAPSIRIKTGLLCALYFVRRALVSKLGCSVHTSMRRAGIPSIYTMCSKTKLRACLFKRFYDSPSLYGSIQSLLDSDMHARKNIYLLLRAYSYMPKMVDLCILRCSNRLLCAYFDAPSRYTVNK